jgi:1,4-alpha-glucan branching enzyme
MKNNNEINKASAAADTQQSMKRKYSSDKTLCRVTFWLPREAAQEAKTVAVAGSFNDWSVARNPMKRLKNGDFSLELDLQAGKEHQFRFVIDGARWVNAWNADKYVWSDHARCENSVIIT